MKYEVTAENIDDLIAPAEKMVTGTLGIVDDVAEPDDDMPVEEPMA